jgi:hypothetical protein
LKPEHTTAARSLRAVSLAITLVSIVTFATVIYSAYAGYTTVLDISRSGTSAVSATTVVQGSSETLFLNATVPNKGLLPIQVNLSCAPSHTDVSCPSASLTVGPGQTRTLHFNMTVTNFAQYLSNPGGLHVNGTLTFELVPFAGLSVSVDLATLVHQGGG